MVRFATKLFAALAFVGVSAHAANPQVDLDTSAGKIRIELYPDAAPKTVENFLAYVKSKQYDGTQFHRVIPGFMVQGGGFTADFVQKPASRPPLQNEAEQSSKAGLLNVPGTVAMARTSDPNSATTQFFINVADNKFLNFRAATPQGYVTRCSARSSTAWASCARSPRCRRAPVALFPRTYPTSA